MKYILKKDLPWAKKGTEWELDYKIDGDFYIMLEVTETTTRHSHEWAYSWEDTSDWFAPIDTRWEPGYEMHYFFSTSNFKIMGDTWDGTAGDKWLYESGNCFKSRADAETARTAIKSTLAKLRDDKEIE